MKRALKVIGSFFVMVVFVINSSAVIALQDEPGGDSPDAPHPERSSPPMAPDDSHFIAEAGDELDQYLFQADGDGYIRFNIPITRYYFNEVDANSNIKFDTNGFLTSQSIKHVTDKHILPENFTLWLRVWDVDEDDDYCPEVDYLLVNNKTVYQGSSQTKLSGANNTWSTPSYQIPIDVLKFPQSKGSGGNPPQPANNEIAIAIDSLGCNAWAVEIDWGVIEIPSPVRPIIFAHGWTGTTDTFNDFEMWMIGDGIPSAGQPFLEEGISEIAPTANLLKSAIDLATVEYGVDKLNIIAHSKGGLVIRMALRDAATAKKVDNVITLASPHHGSWMAEVFDFVNFKCLATYGANLVKAYRCYDAAQEFRTDTMRMKFNYFGCTKTWPWSSWQNCSPRYIKQPNVNYYSFANDGDEAVVPLRSITYPWNADAVPFPTTINVNELFDLESGWLEIGDHGAITTDENVYRCALSYLSPEVYSASTCPNGKVVTGEIQSDMEEVIPTIENYQTILSYDGHLSAGGSQTVNSRVDSGEVTAFKVYASQPLNYSLVDPNGVVINSNTVNSKISYTSKNNTIMWLYEYQIKDPTPGLWTNIVQATSSVDYLIINEISNSPYLLSSSTEKLVYSPNETITLRAVMTNGVLPLTATTFTGAVTYPDTSVSALSFYDNGTHGDQISNDGIYTTQFNALSVKGQINININASKGNTIRAITSVISVSPQTGYYQSVSYDYPEDDNVNGFYDYLDIGVYINVVTSGHFEIQGTLSDSSGKPIATGFFSSLMNGSNPLASGSQLVVLRFDGTQIYTHGSNGPYTLSNLIITDVNDSAIDVDYQQNIYSTDAYLASQFEHPLITFSSGSEDVDDTDNDGLYNSLNIYLPVEVAQSGTYEINGRLIDQYGDEIAWSRASFYAPYAGEYTAEFKFDGYEIGAHKRGGQYKLKDVSIFKVSNGSSALIETAYTTISYDIKKFEGVVPAFSDTPLSYWSWKYIEAIYAAGITTGCSTSPLPLYCPENSVTRAQMAVFLERGIHGASFNPPSANGNIFLDVPKNYWAAAWIEKLASDGITSGCEAGNYCPDQAVSRAQMAIFLLRSKHGAGYVPPQASGIVFNDVPASYWASAWIEQLASEGVTGGCGSGIYCPNDAVTRAQMAVFLQRIFNLPLP